MIYIGVTLLHFPEHEVWHMTPYKITKLFEIHREFNPDRFETKNNPHMDPIDAALAGF